MFESLKSPGFLKMGLLGLAGSGKTFTGSSVAAGLIKKNNVPSPLYFFDTEGGSAYLKKKFEKLGVEVKVEKTRAFSDLIKGLELLKDSGAVVIIDSITHFWTEFVETYRVEKQRGKSYRVDITFPDWAYLKREWSKFTTLFLNSSLHIIMCGRQGYEYSFQQNDENGKKELIKDDIKMKAETETGYEPSLLVHMARSGDADATGEVDHIATVLKDRFDVMDGKKITNPSYADFKPHIDNLDFGSPTVAVGDNSSKDLVNEELSQYQSGSNKKDKDLVIEEIEGYLNLAYPGSSADNKKSRTAWLNENAKTPVVSGLCKLKLDELKELRKKSASLSSDKVTG